MGRLSEEFDEAVQQLVEGSRLSASKVKNVTQLATKNIDNDEHMVSTLFRVHRNATASQKLSSLYLIDAIARDCKAQVKKLKGKGDIGDRGTFQSFLNKLEIILERVVMDNWENGEPHHREKVQKVVDIWLKSSTFEKDLLEDISNNLNSKRKKSGHIVDRETVHRGSVEIEAVKSTDDRPHRHQRRDSDPHRSSERQRVSRRDRSRSQSPRQRRTSPNRDREDSPLQRSRTPPLSRQSASPPSKETFYDTSKHPDDVGQVEVDRDNKSTSEELEFRDFDAASVESWEKLARICKEQWGYIPTNEEMIALIMGAPSFNSMQPTGGMGMVGLIPGMGNGMPLPMGGMMHQ